MAGHDPKHRQKVALFRYERIADLLRLEPGSKEWGRRLRERAAEECDIPGSQRRRVSASTLRRWVSAYRECGLEALHPRIRCDRGRRRALDAEVAALLVEIKERSPALSVRRIIERARSEGALPSTVKLAPTTVYRLLRGRGLMRPAPEDQPAQDMRRWCYELAGELWMSDVLHGPKVRDVRKGLSRRRKTYLASVLDDATRVVPHAAFAFGERYVDVAPVFQRALLKRGLPDRLYVDNGSAFRCRALRVVCASLDIQLVHSRVYRPQGRGKIERFFGTVRSQFLRPLEHPGKLDLEQLNKQLGAWLEGEYHQTPHHGLEAGRSPQDQWALTSQRVRPSHSLEELERLFCIPHQRKISADHVLQFQGRKYELRSGPTGVMATMLVDPLAPPERPIPVECEGRPIGRARLLDRSANNRVPRRRRRTAKDRSAESAPEPQPPRLQLSGLRPSDASAKDPQPASRRRTARRPPPPVQPEEETP